MMDTVQAFLDIVNIFFVLYLIGSVPVCSYWCI